MLKRLLNKAKVLIVDDEPSNVRLLERILEMFGCTQCCSTSDARQALPKFLEFAPDLVLLDLHMPHLDGFQVIEQLNAAISPEEYLPILVLTADITVETKRRALASGAKDFVTKPLDHFEIVLRMKNLLENRFLHLELTQQNSQLEKQVSERTGQLEETLEKLRSTQEQVVRQERLSALGMMAGGIAHDFNNALTLMLGYSELLLPHFQNAEQARELEHLRHVISAAEDAAHVVRRLRDFYRPAGDHEVRLPVDLNDLVSKAVLLTSPKWKGKAQSKGVQIHVQTQLGEVPEIAANAAELREVLTNFIFNAVDAMPEGGEITVCTGTHPHGVFLSVRDTGTGMDESECERCLEPFFTTKGELGTGLGLSVVYGIVQRHGGTINIQSTPQVGTTFCVVLPVTTAQTVPCAKIDAPADQVQRPLRILAVDDQEIIAELLAEYLRNDGHTVVLASDGASALARFQEQPFDLIITDQSMPVMNGEQLAVAIAEIAPNIPILMLTGFGEEMAATGNCPKCINLVLGKPVRSAELRQAVLQLTSTRPARSALLSSSVA